MNWNWVTWPNITPYVLAIPGLIALWRTIRNERVKLAFYCVPFETGGDEALYDEEVRCGCSFIITNNGAKPVTIATVSCRFAIQTAAGEGFRASEHQVNEKLSLGDTAKGSVNICLERWTFGQNTMARPQVVAVDLWATDSTGKRWKLSNKERVAFEIEAYRIWPLRNSARRRKLKKSVSN
ncbi:MAG TPA: hypothetical protein VK789_32155 [Bryobacteraceae bacterium]|nr:hypothetical protein [Bryobacteraceae bacterium]